VIVSIVVGIVLAVIALNVLAALLDSGPGGCAILVALAGVGVLVWLL
jgi:hypothetical protein